MTRRRRAARLELAGLLLAAALAAGLLAWGARSGRAGEPGGRTLWPAGGGALVVWRSDTGPLVARFTSAAGRTTERSLGAGSDVRLISGGPRPVLLVTAPGGGHRLLRFSPISAAWTTIAAALPPDDLTTAALSRGLLYLPVGTGRRAAVLATDAGGGIVARLALPVLEPDPTALVSGPGAAIEPARPGRGRVRALLVAGGDVLALTATDQAAAITDLRTHETASLAAYTRLAAATVGGDGFVYLLAGRSDPAFTLRFLRVAVHPLRVLWAWDTDAAPDGTAVTALPTRFGAAFYAPAAPGSPASSGADLWLIDSTGARRDSAVSTDLGPRMGPGRGDSVLLYGGQGGAVTRLDTDDGARSRADARLRAPSGATVLLAAD